MAVTFSLPDGALAGGIANEITKAIDMRKKNQTKGIPKKGIQKTKSKERVAFFLSDDLKQVEPKLKEFQKGCKVGILEAESVLAFVDLCGKLIETYGEDSLQSALLVPHTSVYVSDNATTGYQTGSRGAATIVRRESGRFKVNRDESGDVKGFPGATIRVRIPQTRFACDYGDRTELDSIEILECSGGGCELELYLKVRGINDL